MRSAPPAASSGCSGLILKPFSDFETFRRGTPSARSLRAFFMASTSRGVRSHSGFAFEPVFDFRAAIDSPFANLANTRANEWLVNFLDVDTLHRVVFAKN